MAGALVAAWPGTLYISTREFGFYWAQFVLVVAATALAIRLVATGPRWDHLTVAALGGVAGLAWWQSPQAAFVLLPLAVSTVAFARPPARAVVIAIATTAIGATPWLVALAEYGPRRLFSGPQHAGGYLTRLHGVWTNLLPSALGLRGSYRGGWLFGGVGVALFVAAIGAFVVLVVRELRAPLSTVTPLVWCAVAFPFLVAIPPATGHVVDPRYGILLVPIAALFMARHVTSTAALIVVVLTVGLLSSANLANLLHTASSDVHGLELRPANPNSASA